MEAIKLHFSRQSRSAQRLSYHPVKNLEGFCLPTSHEWVQETTSLLLVSSDHERKSMKGKNDISFS